MEAIEGLIKDEYWRLFSPADWDDVSAMYESDVYLDGFKIIGSVDLDAISLSENGRIFKVPFVPLDFEYSKPMFDSLEKLGEYVSINLQRANEEEKCFGLQSHLIKPIVFGGNPADKENHTFVPQSKHAEVCCYWNKVYKEVKSTS